MKTFDHFGFWFDQPMISLDFETTGFEATRGDRIVEIGAVRVEKLKVVGQWHTFLNPGRPIPDDASLAHGIYDEDVARAPTFEQKAGEFLAFCDGAVPCAYNESFDRGFAMAELWALGMPLTTPLLNWPCWLNPLAWVRSIDRFVVMEDGSRPSNNLAAACERRGIALDGAHGAIADATAAALLLEAIASDMPRCTISELLRRQPLLSLAHDKRRQAAKASGRVP